MNDTQRLCIHTITTRPWPIETAVEKYAGAGVAGITVWRDALEGRDVAAVARRIRDAGLVVVSTARCGFFPSVDGAEREAKLDEARRAVDEAAALGAPHTVLVCGAEPKQPLSVSRDQIREALERLLPYAEKRGVRLAVEPLHPMYADSRSAINTLKQANDLCDRLGHPSLGVAVDVYHLWWDPDLEAEIRRCGESGRLAAFHVCDWRVPTTDFLWDRGLMGEGCINVREIRGWVEAAGFSGFNEVEIFSHRFWARDQDEFLRQILAAYAAQV